MATPRHPPARDSGAGDPLGPVIEQHGITWAALIVVTIVLGATGGAILGYGATRVPRSTLWLTVGGIVLGLGVLMFVLNVRNTGRRLELRKRGIRFVDAGDVTELNWSEIVEVDVHRLDKTSVGPVHKFRESDDAVSPSSLLTKTEWEVTLRTNDGRSIHLPPAFFRIVPDARKLISAIKLRAGV